MGRNSNGKRVMGGLLVLSLTAALGACSSKGNDDGAGNNTSGEGMSKKFTITSLNFTYEEIPPNDGIGLKMINEKFNVDYKPLILKYSDYAAKLASTIAGGDIPDTVAHDSPDANYFRWSRQGVFLPLNDYIDKYPTFKIVPKSVWDAVTVDGKIYAIPKYFPQNYLQTMIIRQDWLDNLGLEMPTNYEELKQVAIAFTKNDPDGNGKDDTYGLVVGANIHPSGSAGTYWDAGAWYHRDENGQLIPGIISEARKELIAWLAELYKEKAMTRDFVLMKDYNAVSMEFWGGKAGIFLGQPRGESETYMQALLKSDPRAKVVGVPPFKAPDGSRGFTAGSGFYMMTSLNANLAKQPEKLERILQMIDFGRKFHPVSERNEKNPEFDWAYGYAGKGYEIIDGQAVPKPPALGLSPHYYFIDNRMWAPSDKDNEYSKGYKSPQLREYTAGLEKLHEEVKHYVNPIHFAYSETKNTKNTELTLYILGEQSKMIVGERPISDWDKVVQEWMDRGGAQMIREVNESLKGKQPEGFK